ncbi:PEP-CTERM system histidine kinase PrsK [Sphingomonas sabuli]|uniref:histidine kinase n=1 Tax=Sphingomonas sabuli TaxID=2764186 RepID=A0A7G9L5C8_9SPHN|nr:XrtA/PEP-CTERM system histidine kinase PrsK [Sphingomonas sabuli]QNM83827.1 PEP-CTERM system histidine kinase PrsK [Sphingomonas sabuli]
MPLTVAFWSHALAATMFATLLLWRATAGVRHPGHRLLLAAFALTACWAWLEALSQGSIMARYAETARNLVWVSLLYSLSVRGDGRQHGVRLVYGAVSAVLGMQLVATTMLLLVPSAAVAQTAVILRITAAAGALVLVHNLYGQASPSSRSNIRFAMLALASIWAYDLNFYTVAYLAPSTADGLADWRGLAVLLAGPLFALGAQREDDWRIKLSRAATFQSLSLLSICAYFAVMAVLATVLKGAGGAWLQSLSAALLAAMVVAAMVLVPSQRARGWAKVKIAKHFFEHRYDYRLEWLRFTETLGDAGQDARPLGERVVKAFADILESPGGLLIERDVSGRTAVCALWNWSGRSPDETDMAADEAFWASLGGEGIIELTASGSGLVPNWLVTLDQAWVGIPLIHQGAAVGLVVIGAPDYRRALDWEDYDLLKTAGRQAASAFSEAQGQRALADAQRFEEFNRRFAFILHDIKNLASQLSLLARNAERHAENAEFRADMIATLKMSIGKMNGLLARLSPQASGRGQRIQPQPLRDILASAIANRRGAHDVRLLGDCSEWAVVDAAGLEQAVGHLVQNAVEATGGPSGVTVRVSRSGGGVAIAIADTGSGMDAEFVRNRLFQPFASTKDTGFGIGAFEAKGVIEAMGGRIAVDSRPGAGTTFTLHLRAAQAPSADQRDVA